MSDLRLAGEGGGGGEKAGSHSRRGARRATGAVREKSFCSFRVGSCVEKQGIRGTAGARRAPLRVASGGEKNGKTTRCFCRAILLIATPLNASGHS